MVTHVRRRRAWDLNARRGRVVDPSWKYRTLLTCKQANLSLAQRSRLDQILASDAELVVVWAIKEITVQLLATRTSAAFDTEWQQLETTVRATDLPEPASSQLGRHLPGRPPRRTLRTSRHRGTPRGADA